jgi:plasmid stabilization system protein ParE
MPRSEWTAKQERKYEHIVESERDRGASTARAKEIGARTVNKERAQRGQTRTASRTSTEDMPSSRRGGLRSGRPGPRGRTKAQLYNEAKQRGIPGRSKMDKAQLQRAVDDRTRS